MSITCELIEHYYDEIEYAISTLERILEEQRKLIQDNKESEDIKHFNSERMASLATRLVVMGNLANSLRDGNV